MSFHGGILLLQLMIMQLGIGLALATTDQLAIVKPGCRDRCGNVPIPYPFGMKKECYLNKNFLITCNKSTNPPKPYSWVSDLEVTGDNSNLEVTGISLLQGQLQILEFIARDCYTQNGSAREDNFDTPSLTLGRASKIFTISDTQNKLIAVGCDTFAIVQGQKLDDKDYTTGCMSFCDKMEYANESCSAGTGCCEISIPKGLKNFQLGLDSVNEHKYVWGFNPCSYAFVVDEKEFHFSASFMHKLNNTKKLPMVLDWVISNETCEVAKKNKTSYACTKGNSTCHEPDNNTGYRCNCLEGYEGNPYLNDCQDIDECKDLSHECEKPSRCVNTVGNYTCPCPKDYHGNGRRGGDGCIKNRLRVIEVALGIGICIIVLLVGSSLYFLLKRRKLINLKEKFFRENGGLMLQQQLSKRDVSTEMAKIFTAEELEKATNNFDESRIIGRGGFGIVYKGILANDNMVAIKKSKVVDKNQIEQFINEVVILSQINLRNVVKLLGCCLETEVPLLVYEYVTNGTLFDHIHDESKASMLTWEIRLRIAAETAGVLSILHSSASTPIFHRDVKPTNILLDDNYTAKVSDFGASRLVPVDQMELLTMMQGTLGYLDPEYLQTSQLTEKSDVYSFGVVLVELLTGKKVLSFDRPEGERNLSLYFISSLKENRLFQVVEKRIVNNGNIEQVKKVANLAKRCLKVNGEDRPTMREVAMELEALRIMEKHPRVNMNLQESEYLLGVGESPNNFDLSDTGNIELMNFQETKYLLGESSNNFNLSDTGNLAAGYDGILNHVTLPVSDGR